MWYTTPVSESALAGLCVIRCQATLGNGEPAEITAHARQATNQPNTVAGLQGLADSVAAWWGDASVRALHNNSTLLTQVEVADLSPTIFSPVVSTVNLAGTRGTGDEVGVVDSLVVTKLTGFQGRAFRGRLFTFGALAADLNSSGGGWDGSFATEWTAAAEDFADAIATATPVEYRMVLWHKNGYDSVPGPAVGVDTVTNVLSFQGQTRLAVQRGRRG